MLQVHQSLADVYNLAFVVMSCKQRAQYAAFWIINSAGYAFIEVYDKIKRFKIWFDMRPLKTGI